LIWLFASVPLRLSFLGKLPVADHLGDHFLGLSDDLI